jgi:hypothetical protein
MGYLEEARKRASRRKSAWNLLLIPAVFGTWLVMWYVSLQPVGRLLRYMRPDLRFVLLPDSFGGTLIGVGLLLAWLPLAMVIGNILVATVVPASESRPSESDARDHAIRIASGDHRHPGCLMRTTSAVTSPLRAVDYSNPRTARLIM